MIFCFSCPKILFQRVTGGLVSLANIGDNTRKRSPPYVSYHTFRNFLDEVQQQSVPSRIDRTWGQRWSGSTRTQLIAALRFLKLIDDSDCPTQRLKDLAVVRTVNRPEQLQKVIWDCYAFLSHISSTAGTYGEVEDTFRANYQLTPDVMRKCIKFYVALAGEAQIPLSKFITNRVRLSQSGTGTKISSKKRSTKVEVAEKVPHVVELVPDATQWDKMLLAKFPDLDPAWSEELKICWFKDFDILLKMRSIVKDSM